MTERELFELEMQTAEMDDDSRYTKVQLTEAEINDLCKEHLNHIGNLVKVTSCRSFLKVSKTWFK